MQWYEDDVKRIEKIGAEIKYKPETIFYGSSSIRMWDSIYTDFEQLKPINLGFGGSTLEACAWFFDRVMKNYQPKRIVIYAGDNDLGDGKQPEDVFNSFKDLAARKEAMFGDLPCYFVSLKPSIARWPLADKFRLANRLIADEIEKIGNNWHFVDIFSKMLTVDGVPKKEYYVGDGLHMSKLAYELWAEVINSAITANG